MSKIESLDHGSAGLRLPLLLLGLVAMLGLASAPALAVRSDPHKAPLINVNGTSDTCMSASPATPTGKRIRRHQPPRRHALCRVSLKRAAAGVTYFVYLQPTAPPPIIELCENAVGSLTTEAMATRT